MRARREAQSARAAGKPQGSRRNAQRRVGEAQAAALQAQEPVHYTQ